MSWVLILLALPLSIRYPPALEFGYTGSFHEGSFCCFSLLSLLPFSTLIIRVWLRLAQSFQESLSCGPHMALLLSLCFCGGASCHPLVSGCGPGSPLPLWRGYLVSAAQESTSCPPLPAPTYCFVWMFCLQTQRWVSCLWAQYLSATSACLEQRECVPVWF